MTDETTKIRSKTRRRLRGWWIALIAVGSVGLLVAGAAGFFAWSLSSSFDSQTTKLPDIFPSDDASRPPVLEGVAAQAQNILLLGSDTRGENDGSIDDLTGQRSDTMMVVHVPADRANISVMSIMRDSWLEIPGEGKAKINAALSLGGVPLALQTVESLLGVRVDHVAIIDFEGFKGVTDALGGVDIDNPVAFDSSHLPGHTFAAGVHNLGGVEALAFVRERYAFTDGDYQRVRNQQAFIKAVLGKILTAETLTNPATLSGVVGAVAPYLSVDEGLDSAYLAGLGVELREVRMNNVTFFTLPSSGTGTSPDGQSIVVIDQEKLALVQRGFQTDTLVDVVPQLQAAG
ncbi:MULTISPECIES: LCP family protein [Cryobacterium]|uniref:LCP family protein n=1 Tax=Cryobacterium TaxID=69578 RepID=UPI000CD4841C|nr:MULTISPECIES: LCP family protein [Cryobacterium]POH69215.1 transcriptional regulator [Cryobacterium zongtaii]TFC41080.1 LytR family transcriptional regulator [Cryobacterium sp. TMN-39-2]